MFPYKAAIFGLVPQSPALKPSELPEHCTGIFYFIHCGLSRNYSTTIEALPQIAGDIGLEPINSAPKTDVLPITPISKFKFVYPLGLEPRTTTLKVSCSTY